MGETDQRDVVFISATEAILYAGCDYRTFWLVTAAIFFIVFFLCWHLPFFYQGLSVIGVGVLVEVIAIKILQELAKEDPLQVQLYFRHIRWPKWMPANGKVSTFRNPNKLVKRKLVRA